MNILQAINETTKFIKSKISLSPEVGIILGTGLGGLADKISEQQILPYAEIPNFPVSTVEGHSGMLIFGKLGGKNVVAMKGRFHYYEGYTPQEVTFPVRVMKSLGVQNLFISNAAGGMNPNFAIGDLMIINDHINLIPNPLIGRNVNELGPRFPDMSQPYDPILIQKAKKIGETLGIQLHTGCYVGVTGPTFETPKEYQYFRIIGGDAVGMSTVPEVIVAAHSNLPVFAMSIITDLGLEGNIVPADHEEVQKEGAKAEAKMTRIMTKLLEDL